MHSCSIIMYFCIYRCLHLKLLNEHTKKAAYQLALNISFIPDFKRKLIQLYLKNSFPHHVRCKLLPQVLQTFRAHFDRNRIMETKVITTSNVKRFKQCKESKGDTSSD